MGRKIQLSELVHCPDCGATYHPGEEAGCPNCGAPTPRRAPVAVDSRRPWVARTARDKRPESGLVCPLCGNDHIISEGSFYQCKSDAARSWVPGMSGRDPGWAEEAKHGCGYLGPLSDFNRKQGTLG